MSKTVSAIHVPALILALGIGTAQAADWPRFLGPTDNGVSSETGLLNTFPADGPSIVWQKQIGTGYSAPSIRDGKLVLYHRRGNEEIVEALNPVTGESLWRQTNPTTYVDPYGYNNGPRCTPLLTADRVFTFGAQGLLSCLNLKDGSVIWRRDTAKEFQVPEAFFGVGSTPLLEGDKLIVMVGGQTNSGMVAFAADTGKTIWESVGTDNWSGQPMHGWPGERAVVWKSWDKQASYSSPVAATMHGRRVVFCFMRQGLVALDPETGRVFDSFWFRATVEESVNAINPVVMDNHVFISAAYYKVGSVLLEVTPELKFKETWRDTVAEIHWTTPILLDGHLYTFSGRNEPDASFRCVELLTGKLKWERNEAWRKTLAPPNQFGRGSAILADGKLIALGEAGLLGLFRPNPEKLEEIGRWQVPGLHYPCWAAPVLSDKRLYLRSEDRLVCLDFAH